MISVHEGKKNPDFSHVPKTGKRTFLKQRRLGYSYSSTHLLCLAVGVFCCYVWARHFEIGYATGRKKDPIGLSPAGKNTGGFKINAHLVSFLWSSSYSLIHRSSRSSTSNDDPIGYYYTAKDRKSGRILRGIVRMSTSTHANEPFEGSDRPHPRISRQKFISQPICELVVWLGKEAKFLFFSLFDLIAARQARLSADIAHSYTRKGKRTVSFVPKATLSQWNVSCLYMFVKVRLHSVRQYKFVSVCRPHVRLVGAPDHDLGSGWIVDDKRVIP